ncbi:MAG: hypothetical protein RI897_1803 [Verrucomicrobiota bacterium]|jgi:hypothetical protein
MRPRAWTPYAGGSTADVGLPLWVLGVGFVGGHGSCPSTGVRLGSLDFGELPCWSGRLDGEG